MRRVRNQTNQPEVHTGKPKEEIKDLKGGLICQGNSSKVVARLDMKEGRQCTDINWCSEKETEEECQIPCHSLTGNFEKNYIFCFLYIIFSVINLDIMSSELEISNFNSRLKNPNLETDG